ncbi:hypothetical protein [Algibacter mikhailovii]|uniref:Uncharacterized protein n=1 Tax=Algibacter mikhailovii TaxID=425498 RepID=A0A918QX65_9FLAO|nr:hypothetical protein [Algibacter mikhailovii]GGZ73929.1 hypothetical protein GCM10007028_09030 [Algibacter mikhailovii]
MMTINFNMGNDKAFESTMESYGSSPAPISINTSSHEEIEHGAPSPENFEEELQDSQGASAPRPEHFDDAPNSSESLMPSPDLEEESMAIEHSDHMIPEPSDMEEVAPPTTTKKTTKKTTSRSKAK